MVRQKEGQGFCLGPGVPDVTRGEDTLSNDNSRHQGLCRGWVAVKGAGEATAPSAGRKAPVPSPAGGGPFSLRSRPWKAGLLSSLAPRFSSRPEAQRKGPEALCPDHQLMGAALNLGPRGTQRPGCPQVSQHATLTDPLLPPLQCSPRLPRTSTSAPLGTTSC